MIERGDGCVITITSRVGLGYAISNGAVCRLAGIIDSIATRGFETSTSIPGVIRTERIAQVMASFGFIRPLVRLRISLAPPQHGWRRHPTRRHCAGRGLRASSSAASGDSHQDLSGALGGERQRGRLPRYMRSDIVSLAGWPSSRHVHLGGIVATAIMSCDGAQSHRGGRDRGCRHFMRHQGPADSPLV